MPGAQNSVLDLAGAVYDAALAPELWPEALGRIADFAGGVSAALVSLDTAAGRPRFSVASGAAPDACAVFAETRVHRTARVGEAWGASQLMPAGEWPRSRLNREWARRQGCDDVGGALVERSQTAVTALLVAFRGADGPAALDALGRIASIATHVARALATARLLEASRAEARALGDAIDALGAAVFLLRCDGGVAHANSSGRQLAAAGDVVVCGADGRLSMVDEPGRRELERAVATSAAQGEGSAIPLASRTGARYVADVLPLKSTGRPGRADGSATAAVFVHKAEDPVFPLDALARHFDLSKAELRVLVGVLEIGPPAGIASALGLSEATVRTHLRRLFEKSGTSRQADLVKLVAGYAGPVSTVRSRLLPEPCRV